MNNEHKMNKYVINPETNRFCVIGGSKWKKLYKRGLVPYVDGVNMKMPKYKKSTVASPLKIEVKLEEEEPVEEEEEEEEEKEEELTEFEKELEQFIQSELAGLYDIPEEEE